MKWGPEHPIALHAKTYMEEHAPLATTLGMAKDAKHLTSIQYTIQQNKVHQQDAKSAFQQQQKNKREELVKALEDHDKFVASTIQLYDQAVVQLDGVLENVAKQLEQLKSNDTQAQGESLPAGPSTNQVFDTKVMLDQFASLDLLSEQAKATPEVTLQKVMALVQELQRHPASPSQPIVPTSHVSIPPQGDQMQGVTAGLGDKRGASQEEGISKIPRQASGPI